MRGCVDNHIRRNGSHGMGEAFQIGKAAAEFLAVVIQRDQFAQRRQAALQLPADLAVFAEQQDLHHVRTA